MSMDMVFVNGFVIIIFLFLIYCVIFRFRDARFSFLNLLRHRRRSLSTTCAIILGGVAIFLYGGFISYSFWILQQQIIRTNIGHVQVYNKGYFDTANKSKYLINNYADLKHDMMNNSSLAGDISTLSGQLEFTGIWIGPYISRHFLSLYPLLVRRRRYSRGERYPSALCGCHSL